jgi:hypothetical protein
MNCTYRNRCFMSAMNLPFMSGVTPFNGRRTGNVEAVQVPVSLSSWPLPPVDHQTLVPFGNAARNQGVSVPLPRSRRRVPSVNLPDGLIPWRMPHNVSRMSLARVGQSTFRHSLPMDQPRFHIVNVLQRHFTSVNGCNGPLFSVHQAKPSETDWSPGP